VILGIFVACSKDEKGTYISNGKYIGTFKRDHAGSDFPTANVSITFISNLWTGQSDFTKYPALCHGSYKIEGNKIIFENECGWTTEFDWSLILSGEYSISIENGILEISRDYSNTTDTFKDIYILEKEK
jgi:hypothetical protein